VPRSSGRRRRAFAFASGCAAAATLLNTLHSGDHVLCGDDVYGGTYRLFTAVLRPLGIESTFIDMRALENVEQALTARTRMIWLETPTNPLLRLIDIAAVTGLGKARGYRRRRQHLRLPILQSPLALVPRRCCTRRRSTSTDTRTWSEGRW